MHHCDDGGISTTPINHDVSAQLTLPSFQGFCTVRDPYTEEGYSLPLAPLGQSFPPHEHSLRFFCVPLVHDEAYVGRDDLSPSRELHDAVVVAVGVADVREELNPRPVYLVSGPGGPCHGG